MIDIITNAFKHQISLKKWRKDRSQSPVFMFNYKVRA